MKTVTVAQARAKLAEYVRRAEAGKPVLITRRGKAVVALVSADQVGQLERLQSAEPSAGLAGLAGGWPGSEELLAVVGDESTRPRGQSSDRVRGRRPR